jgi:LmbE family N-acetylglucosaminyl deacetylase
MKILIIAPHPDDEILGCGGTICKHNDQGDNVFLCLATKAYTPDWSQNFLKKRIEEIKKANQALQIKKTYFLNFPTAKLDTVPQKKINDKLLRCLHKVKPDIIYIPHQGDLSKDHRLIFEAALVAARPYHSPSIKKILSYEVPSETEWGQPIKSFVPNVYVDITATLKTKIEAMSCYQSEIRPYPHPRSLKALENQAKKRGSETGVRAAEAFMLIREII